MRSAQVPLNHVSRRIHSTVRHLLSEGADGDEVSLALLAYALSMEFEARGNRYVADHLQRLSRKFAAGANRTFVQIAHGPHSESDHSELDATSDLIGVHASRRHQPA